MTPFVTCLRLPNWSQPPASVTAMAKFVRSCVGDEVEDVVYDSDDEVDLEFLESCQNEQDVDAIVIW